MTWCNSDMNLWSMKAGKKMITCQMRNTRVKCERHRCQTILNKKQSWGNVDVWCMIFKKKKKRIFSDHIHEKMLKRCLWCQQFNCPLETESSHCFSHLNMFPNWNNKNSVIVNWNARPEKDTISETTSQCHRSWWGT